MKRFLDWFRRESPAPREDADARRLRHLELTTAKLIREGFTGQFHAAFHGRGIEFHQLRHYQPGDDIRTIDWNVTARSGVPHVKEFIEERDLTIMICLDTSGSMGFGSVDRRKIDVAVELVSVFAFAANHSRDRVGLVTFGDEIRAHLRPGRSTQHVQRLVRDAFGAGSRCHGGSDYAVLAEFLAATLKRQSIIILLTDLLGGSEPALRPVAFRHDLIITRILDPRERAFPSRGIAELEDAETGERIAVDLGRAGTSQLFAQVERSLEREAIRSATDVLNLSTVRPFDRDLIRFFESRIARSSRRIAS
ncbi:MAG: DUF58 domain-containing protein [Acidobacteria bacterium]|nr:DUF58 domain-containing protein [Acidobacteriota bacterium]